MTMCGCGLEHCCERNNYDEILTDALNRSLRCLLINSGASTGASILTTHAPGGNGQLAVGE